ncbi:hypothetical protein HYR82_02145 [Candidatus Peregrinibacteria bacterium]|nr:hypothetical protein [Candidatus Peregrinibacteria bacterium]
MPQNVPIRAIAARFSFRFSQRALEHAFRAYPFEFCAGISTEARSQRFEGLSPKQQEWFDSSEVRNAHYASVDWDDIAPLDEDVILRMRECEALFMSVVTRLEPKYTVPFLTRKLWYLRHLQFWNDYLTRHRINLFLSAWIPHEIPDIILYHLCKLRGIPVLYFTMEFRDVSFLEHDITRSAPQVGERYRTLLTEYVGRDPATISLAEPFASYEQGFLVPDAKPMDIAVFALPTYWTRLCSLTKRPLAFLRAVLRFCTPSGCARAWWALYRLHTQRQTEGFYDEHAAEPDLTKPFVYFPLHYQPEATTLPMGGVYADQILIARMLNAELPEGVILYIKEHPSRSNWQSRSVEYYKEFLQLSKVRFVPKRFNTFLLREHCRAVATVTGSAGFEGLFRGKPVFLFGTRYYENAQGVFPIRSLRDCREAVSAIFERGEAPTPLSTHLYLKAMEETCVRGLLDSWGLKITRMTEEEHSTVMGKTIVAELKSMHDDIARAFLPPPTMQEEVPRVSS